MNDSARRTKGSAVLGMSLVLFGLFAAQAAYQVYRLHRTRRDANAQLLAELADATILEDEPAPASAGWPQWRGPHRDGVTHAPDLRTDWPEDGPPQAWQARIGGGYSSFAVKDGRVYTLFQEADQEVVICWRAKDGNQIWRYPYDCRYAPQFPGPRSTPALDGDRLYTVGSAGTFLCLDAATGAPRWKKDLLGEFHAKAPQWGVTFSPLIDGDLVFTQPGGRRGSSVAAFHKITGDLVWQALDDKPAYSSPLALTIAGSRQIVFFTGGALVGVTAQDGKECWRFPWKTSYDVNAATPLAFRARKGDEVLHYVFISSGYDKGCALVKIAPTKSGRFDARAVYQGDQMRSHFASPVRRGDYLYGIDEARLVCMNVRTGEVKWSRTGSLKGSLLRVDDRLLVLGENGVLQLLDASPAEPNESVAEARPFRGRCWTMPVLTDGRLFLRAEERVKCLDVRKK